MRPRPSRLNVRINQHRLSLCVHMISKMHPQFPLAAGLPHYLINLPRPSPRLLEFASAVAETSHGSSSSSLCLEFPIGH